jgi:hypothetical protein
MLVGFFTGIASCLAIGVMAYVRNDRRQRLAFMASLPSQMQKRLSDFETSRGGWKEFRALQQAGVASERRNNMRFPPAG